MSEQELAELHSSVLLAAGWTRRVRENPWAPGWLSPAGQAKSCPPPLTLDWLHEIEHAIPENGYIFFESALKKIVREDWFNGKFPQNLADSFPCHASAKQRARAFIATIQPK